MNIAGAFHATASRLPDQPFLVDRDDRTLTYADVRTRVQRFRRILSDRGVKAGDRIVISFPNCADYICAYLGALSHGCIATLVDSNTTPAHLAFVMKDTGASLWVGYPSRPGAGEVPGHLELSTLERPLPASEMDEVETAPTGDALIMYTSGTTGKPKGVRLSHANLLHTREAITGWAEVQEDNRELTTLSLTHLFGLAHVHIAWTLGGSVIIDEGLSDVPGVLRRMRSHQATSFPATPAGIKLLLDAYGSEFASAASSLRYIIINSAPIPTTDVERLMELLPHVRCYMYYGLTEASRSTWLHYNRHTDKLHTVGRPSPGCELRIATPDDGSDTTEDSLGEIQLRGPHVTPGYWGGHDDGEFVDGWFRTGDLGTLDSDGFVTWKGRLKEQINVDGLKVSPREVEAVLLQHPAVSDCAVTGEDDAIYGQVVVAHVVPAGTMEDDFAITLRRFCLTHLEKYKVPRHVRVISEVPRTDSGKVKRLLLKSSERG